MSDRDVYPLLTGWVGWGQGAELFVREDTPLDAEHPLVLARPDLFSEPEPAVAPVRRGPARPLGSRNRPKPPPAPEGGDDG